MRKTIISRHEKRITQKNTIKNPISWIIFYPFRESVKIKLALFRTNQKRGVYFARKIHVFERKVLICISYHFTKRATPPPGDVSDNSVKKRWYIQVGMISQNSDRNRVRENFTNLQNLKWSFDQIERPNRGINDSATLSCENFHCHDPWGHKLSKLLDPPILSIRNHSVRIIKKVY